MELKKITKEELDEVLKLHKLWCYSNGKEGKIADLSNTNLSGMDLSNTNLSGANLSYADLTGTKLHWTNFINVNLSGANLSSANIFGGIMPE